MKLSFTPLLSIAALCLYGSLVAGCGQTASTTSTQATKTTTTAPDDHDHGDHDHSDGDHDHGDHDHGDHDHGDHDHSDGDHDHGDHSHDGHDHPAHGPHGGHMAELSGGAHAEWAHNDETETITVYPEDAEQVTKVEMKTMIEGVETVYLFEKSEVDGATAFELTSPELLTSIKMGDVVDTKLVLTTADGEVTGAVKHHAH